MHPLLYPPVVALLFVLDVGDLLVMTLVAAMPWVVVAVVSLVAASRTLRLEAAPEGGPALGELLRFGARAHFGRLMPTDVFRPDQLIVAVFLSPVALGIYTVAWAFTNLTRALTQAIGVVAYPSLAGQRDATRAQALMWRYAALASGIGLAITAVLGVGATVLVPALFGSEFDAAVPVAQWLLPAAALVGVRRTLVEALRGMGHPLVGTVSEGVGAVTLAGGALLLVPAFDVTGVAIADALASAASLGAVLVALFVRSSMWDRLRGTTGQRGRGATPLQKKA
jgi:O-antigen/teichoic acid export membrane protein